MANIAPTNKSKHLVSALVFLLTAISVLAEPPVDAPGQVKVTVAAEISRGFSNISDFAREHPDLRFAIFASRLRRRSLTQAGTSDSPGFTLGARLAELACLDALMRSDQTHGKNSVSDTQAATAVARELCRDVRSREQALGLKDSDLLRAIGEPHSTGIADLLSRYDAMAEPAPSAASPAPPPTSSPVAFSSPPPPEFVRLTSKTTLRDAKGRDVKTLERGHRLRVADRTETEVTVYHWSDKFAIPIGSTEPSP